MKDMSAVQEALVQPVVAKCSPSVVPQRCALLSQGKAHGPMISSFLSHLIGSEEPP